MLKPITKVVKFENHLTLTVAVATLAFAIRVVNLSSKGLWYDELQSVTHAFLPLSELTESVRIHDPHPPLYYIQLHLWMSFGTSDLWIKLNSVLWSVLATVSLFIVGRDVFNTRVATIASLLFAMSPYSVACAQEARMYSLLMCIGIWIFFFTHQFLYSNRFLLMGIGTIVSTVAFLYSHGAGFVVLASEFSYVIVYLLRGGNFDKWKRLLKWGFVQLIILMLYMPWLSRARSISVGHTSAPNLRDVIDTFFELLFGFGATHPNWLRWVGLLLAIVTTTTLLTKDRNSLNTVISFVMAPISFCVIISHLIKPIWLHRTLAYSTPFLTLAISLAISNLFGHTSKRDTTRFLLGLSFFTLASLILLLALVNHQQTISHGWNIREAAKFIQAVAHPEDIIYVPSNRVFWGLSWYLVGPGSVNPVTKEYSLVTKDGIKVLSKPAIYTFVTGGQSYWIIYRDIDSITPFESQSQDFVRDFSGLNVGNVYLGINN